MSQRGRKSAGDGQSFIAQGYLLAATRLGMARGASDDWRRVLCAAALVLAMVMVLPLCAQELDDEPNRLDLIPGRWVEIHRQHPNDGISFVRQTHAGSAFDTRRGRIVIFGSDTHGKDWTNAPLSFDVASLNWSRAYPNDEPSTYRVSSDGFPVAGIDGRVRGRCTRTLR